MAAPAQRAQMQARRCASTGTLSNNSGVKTASVHQQGPCAIPVAFSASLAHWLLWPHIGHLLVSMAAWLGISGMASLFAWTPQFRLQEF